MLQRHVVCVLEKEPKILIAINAQLLFYLSYSLGLLMDYIFVDCSLHHSNTRLRDGDEAVAISLLSSTLPRLTYGALVIVCKPIQVGKVQMMSILLPEWDT